MAGECGCVCVILMSIDSSGIHAEITFLIVSGCEC